MSDANNFWTIVYIDDNGIGKGYTGDKNVVEFVKKELAPIGWRIEGSVVDFNLSEGFMDMTTKLATTDGGWLSVKISEGTTHGCKCYSLITLRVSLIEPSGYGCEGSTKAEGGYKKGPE